jgi:ring-1,2-phenylacetyl-CoA epoxidase subunit PaaE
MIIATETALINSGVPADRVHAERFTSGPAVATTMKVDTDKHAQEKPANKDIALTVVLDGKHHEIAVNGDEHLLDAALEAGLDLPYACKGGVCCTCRAKLLEGEVTMDKNFTLEADEMAQGFVLSCQARALSTSVRLSFDER